MGARRGDYGFGRRDVVCFTVGDGEGETMGVRDGEIMRDGDPYTDGEGNGVG
jgi:hypothetical protein